MARVNITVPDAVIERAREHGLKVSGLATAALESELARRAKRAEFEAAMAEIEAEIGRPDASQAATTEQWVDNLVEEADQLRRSS